MRSQQEYEQDQLKRIRNRILGTKKEFIEEAREAGRNWVRYRATHEELESLNGRFLFSSIQAVVIHITNEKTFDPAWVGCDQTDEDKGMQFANEFVTGAMELYHEAMAA